ncbi:endonuclease/exonuclease/phosphatase family domain-containing protein 1 [Holotrichia oblita]|nr:endonuclease/exonuclease/phosphatase family domain-containing protein 1 [Holotrichia oblita]
MGFYRRNYIEGLFLSSAVEVSPDATMQKLIDTLELLRNKYKFRAYIHIKAIPGASAHLIDYAATLADRMSVNIELPSESSLKLLAPQKKKDNIITPMKQLANIYIKEQNEHGKYNAKNLPAGQTTQMIIGASPDSDGQIIRLTEALYNNYKLKRVYYSAYVPVNHNSTLPDIPPDLRRENRLYQADWLLRFYGFEASELIPNGVNFSLDVDPKCDWALRNIDKFPVEINTASYEMLLRVPGIGVRNAYRIINARKHSRLTFDSLKKLRISMPRAIYFITADGKYLGIGDKPELIRLRLTQKNNAMLLSEGKENYQEEIKLNYLICQKNLVGFFTAVYDSYYDNKGVDTISSQQNDCSLLDVAYSAGEDVEKAKKVRAGIIKKGGKKVYDSVVSAYRSGNPDKERIIFDYLKLFFEKGKVVLDMYDDARVVAFADLERKVGHEVGRLCAFVRLQEMQNGVYYGYFSSDNDVLEPIMHNLIPRFNTQQFVIHDYKRGKMAYYDGEECRYSLAPPKIEIELSEREERQMANIDAVIEFTNGKTINFELLPEVAPISVANFVELCEGNFYNGLCFHRVIPGFMIQGGGFVSQDGALVQKESKKTIKGEFRSNGVENNLKHTAGVFSMARTMVKDSATSQFFICVADVPYLDGEYAAFGRVTDEESLKVAISISNVRTGSWKGYDDVPEKPVVIKNIRIVK